MNGEARERRWSELRGWEIAILLGLAVVFASVVFLPMLLREDGSAAQRSCQANLMQLHIAFQMYAEEHSGFLPPVQTAVGENCSLKNRDVLMVNGPSFVPQYLGGDPSLLVCPSRGYDGYTPLPPDWLDAAGKVDPCEIDDSSYVYTGWRIEPDYAVAEGTEELEEPFATAFLDVLRSPDPALLDRDWSFINALGEETQVFRLRAEAEGALTVPVMMDTFRIEGDKSLWNHVPPGGNVLYLDGHVEYVRYREGFPYFAAWSQLMQRVKARETSPESPRRGAPAGAE